MPNEAWIDEKGNWMLEKWGHCYKYHADHIVQRLEHEKAELVDSLEKVLRHATFSVWSDTYRRDARELLQKHKGK